MDNKYIPKILNHTDIIYMHFMCTNRFVYNLLSFEIKNAIFILSAYTHTRRSYRTYGL